VALELFARLLTDVGAVVTMAQDRFALLLSDFEGERALPSFDWNTGVGPFE